MKSIYQKLGRGENITVPELLHWLKTEKMAWVIVHPCNGRYFQSDLYFRWSSQTDWTKSVVAHGRKNLFTSEEECLVEALEHMITMNFFKQYL